MVNYMNYFGNFDGFEVIIEVLKTKIPTTT